MALEKRSLLLMGCVSPEQCVDFATSAICWRTIGGSEARFAVEAVTTDDSSGDRRYLSSAVVACDVYGAGTLPKTPMYLFYWCAAANGGSFLRYFREATSHSQVTSDVIRDIRIDMRLRPVRRLSDFGCIADAFDSGAGFVARIIADNSAHEFPVKHINLHREMAVFQVETGPVLLVEPSSAMPAFVAFNRFNRYQFVHDFPAFGGTTGEREALIQLFAYE